MTHEIERSPMRRMLGGTLRANDPRQFLVEVMVGAVHADGHVDDREEDALRRILAEHALFAALPGRTFPALIELATDAFYFAGGVEARLSRIAAALPWRLHRLAAYAMAAELIAADEVVTEDEERYLRSLRGTLQISSGEAAALAEAARQQRALSALDRFTDQIHDFADKAVRVAVALQRQRGPFTRVEAALVERSFRAMVDFEGGPMVGHDRIEQMAIELPASPGDVALELSSRIIDPADRYWALTYALAIDAIRGTPAAWADCELLRMVRLGFELSERSLDRAKAHAGRIAELCRQS